MFDNSADFMQQREERTDRLNGRSSDLEAADVERGAAGNQLLNQHKMVYDLLSCFGLFSCECKCFDECLDKFDDCLHGSAETKSLITHAPS